MFLKGQHPIKKEAQVAPHHLRSKNLFPLVRTHGEGNRWRIATPLARKMEKLSL
jgi:hypothetical protein